MGDSGDPATSPPILIVGAGVSGLTLAQGLHRHSIPFKVFEREVPGQRAQGHRFRIDNDGADALYETLTPELWDLLVRTCATVIQIDPAWVDARTLEDASIPFPKRVAGRGPLPMDRGWIRSLLSLGIEDKISYGKEFQAYSVTDHGVEVRFADGTTESGRLLVGADGIRSRVRRQLVPNHEFLDLERQIVWGRTPSTPELWSQYSDTIKRWSICVDMNPKHPRNSVLEPMLWHQSISAESSGKLPDIKDYIYWLLSSEVVAKPPRTAAEKKAFTLEMSKDWDPSLRTLFELADHDVSACVHVYSSKPDVEPWPTLQNRITLLGDAAHAISPMGGAGANTAVINAADLCRTLVIVDERRTGADGDELERFGERARGRARKSIELSFYWGTKFWKGKEADEYRGTSSY